MRFQKSFFTFFFTAVLFISMLSSPAFAGKGKPGGGMPPSLVSAITIEPKTIQHTQELPGRTTAFKEAEIRPQVTGIITKRLFTEGSFVEKGQQLYQIDQAVYRAVYNSAIADLKKAQANLQSVQAKEKRYKELVKVNAVSKQDYDDAKAILFKAKADIAVADASVAQAEINLNYTKVYAPISGHIGSSSVTEGALVTANQSTMLSQITQLDPIYVDMHESRKKMHNLRRNMTNFDEVSVELTFDRSMPPYEHKGTVQFSEVTVSPTTSSIQMRALFPNPDNLLFPGLFVRANLELNKEEAILVPQKAVLHGPGGSVSVWTLDEKNTVTPVTVKLGEVFNNEWVVTEGLKAGDKVITAGFQKTAPGATAQVTPDK